MPKLHIEVNLELRTTGLRVRDNDFHIETRGGFREKFLNASSGVEFFDRIPLEELGFEVVSTNKGAEVSIGFSKKDGKKGAIFEVSNIIDAPGLHVRIVGGFSRLLRRGADTMLKELGNNLDLRVRTITGKAGSYIDGFSAPVSGGDYEQETQNWPATFPKIDRFEIK